MPLPPRASLKEYERQADELLDAWKTGDPDAIQLIRTKHPRFLDDLIPWLPKDLPESEVRSAALELADTKLAIARWYDFRDWPALAAYVEAVTPDGSPVFLFESAVDAVVNGDLAALQLLLRDHPELIRARSTRITHFDPPVHRATLLHYIAANGVEGYRQRTPANAVQVAAMLLSAGAEVDALADMYGGQCTTMSLLVSSCHPANAGLQVDLAETLLGFGAAVEPQRRRRVDIAADDRSGVRIPEYRGSTCAPRRARTYVVRGGGTGKPCRCQTIAGSIQLRGPASRARFGCAARRS